MQTTSIKTMLAVAGALSLVAAPANAVSKTGIASFYDTSSGTQTASGQRLNDHALTAAMRAPVPLGTRMRVTNLGNGRVVTVTINDRGPFIAGRIIDLTPAGAQALGFYGLAARRKLVMPTREKRLSVAGFLSDLQDRTRVVPLAFPAKQPGRK
jgi:rare lipoprotein A